MRRAISIAVPLALALMGGCAPSASESRSEPVIPVAELAAVQLMKTDPPPSCVEVGTDYEMIVWGDFEGARRKLRRHAIERGGNYVRLEMPAGGTIYRCPVESGAPPLAAASPPPASQPMDPYAKSSLPPPSSKLDRVRMMKADPPSGCAEMGAVAEAIWFGDVEGARTRLRQKAMAMGANYIRLELPTTGTAYRCP